VAAARAGGASGPDSRKKNKWYQENDLFLRGYKMRPDVDDSSSNTHK